MIAESIIFKGISAIGYALSFHSAKQVDLQI